MTGSGPTLRFDGRVVIVTGAGGGLGRAHALALAARGASVVVNDLGTGVDGRGSDASAADAVVDEIVRAGGRAVASAHDVTDPDQAAAAVALALERFGGLHVLVNNAGILRDRSFAKMDAADFEAVLAVHLLGAAYVTRAAWPHMLDRRYGRVVMTTSHAGLHGNFGQANYAAAKMGVVGLMAALAQEGARAGVLVNTLAPLAATRMANASSLRSIEHLLDARAATAVTLRLAHERMTETGLIITAAGRHVGRVRVVEDEGITLDADAVTPEAVAERWPEILAAARPRSYASAFDRVAALFPEIRGLAG